MASEPLTLTFLGTGDAASEACSAAVFEATGRRLLIDCGPGTVGRYQQRYGELPTAVFLTHLHMDHVADLERLFYAAHFAAEPLQPRVFVAAPLVPALCQRLSANPALLAEGGVNFWDRLHLVPVIDSFHWADLTFTVHPARHHQPGTAFSLHLPGVFFYSGDTRPIPEVLHHHCTSGEPIFHDCNPVSSPSHSAAEDLYREYLPDVLARLHVYHYPPSARAALVAAGLRPVEPGEAIALGRAGEARLA